MREIRITDAEKERIDFLRIFLVFLLVLVHFGPLYGSGIPSTVGYTGEDYPVASIVVSFLNFLGFTAVPALSVISGYLFFLGADRYTLPRFREKMRRRLGSLLLPLLLWSGFFVLLGYGLFLATGAYSSIFAPADGDVLFSVANAWLGLTGYPLAIQLWFVRDLVLTVALSPVIWLLVGRAPVLTLLALLALWLSGHTLFIFTKLDVVGFFSLGAAIAMHGWRRDLPRRLVIPLLVIFPLLVLGRAVAPYLLGVEEETQTLYVLTCLMRIIGLVTIWNAAPLLMTGPVRRLTANYCYLAFFIHCAHYPPISYVKAVAGRMLDPQSDAAQLFLYAITVAITLVGAVTAARLTRTVSPRLFAVLSGGRRPPLTGAYGSHARNLSADDSRASGV